MLGWILEILRRCHWKGKWLRIIGKYRFVFLGFTRIKFPGAFENSIIKRIWKLRAWVPLRISKHEFAQIFKVRFGGKMNK